MSEGKGRVNSGYCEFTELLYRIFAVDVDDARPCNQICVAFIDEYGVKDVNKSFVDKECFEKEGDDSGAFAEDKESSIKPCKVAVKDC